LKARQQYRNYFRKAEATQKALLVNAGDLNPAQELATFKNCTQLLFLIKNKISE
jgi:hypothetical protein